MTFRRWFAVVVVVTFATLATWWGTGRHSYTKFEVVEPVQARASKDDPLTGTGFYADDNAVTRVQRRDEFHLGLIPTPQRLFDKHALSVISIVAPLWLALAAGWWIGRRRHPSART